MKAILVLLTMIGTQAFALDANMAVECSPKIKFQGEVASVKIQKGPVASMAAEFTYGSIQGSATYPFTVSKTESTDLKTEIYRDQNLAFDLEIDVEAQTATLKTRVNGHLIRLQNLSCQFNELDRHPGVSMGN